MWIDNKWTNGRFNLLNSLTQTSVEFITLYNDTTKLSMFILKHMQFNSMDKWINELLLNMHTDSHKQGSTVERHMRCDQIDSLNSLDDNNKFM